MSPSLLKWSLRLAAFLLVMLLLLALLLPGMQQARRQAAEAEAARVAAAAEAQRLESDAAAHQEALARLQALHGAADMRSRRVLEQFDAGDFRAIRTLMRPSLARAIAEPRMREEMQGLLEKTGAMANPVQMQAMGMGHLPAQSAVQVYLDPERLLLVTRSRRWGSRTALDQELRFAERDGELELAGLYFETVPYGESEVDGIPLPVTRLLYGQR